MGPQFLNLDLLEPLLAVEAWPVAWHLLPELHGMHASGISLSIAMESKALQISVLSVHLHATEVLT